MTVRDELRERRRELGEACETLSRQLAWLENGLVINPDTLRESMAKVERLTKEVRELGKQTERAA